MDYGLLIIGSGTAAMVAAMQVRIAGWNVAVIDEKPFGGTCALRGCDPKKMLVAGAEVIDVSRRMSGNGVVGAVEIDWPELIAFKRTFTDPVPAKQKHFIGVSDDTSPTQIAYWSIIAIGLAPVSAKSPP